MPIIKAAVKALRQTKRRTIKNLQVKKNLELLNRQLKKALAGQQSAEAKKLIIALQAALDKAAKIHIIHKNKASRLKSRLMKKTIV